MEERRRCGSEVVDVEQAERTPGGSRKCGKQRAFGNAFSDLWQIKELREKSWKCGKEKT